MKKKILLLLLIGLLFCGCVQDTQLTEREEITYEEETFEGNNESIEQIQEEEIFEDNNEDIEQIQEEEIFEEEEKEKVNWGEVFKGRVSNSIVFGNVIYEGRFESEGITGEGKVTFYDLQGKINLVEEGLFSDNGELNGKGNKTFYDRLGNNLDSDVYISRVEEGKFQDGVLEEGEKTFYDSQRKIVKIEEFTSKKVVKRINYYNDKINLIEEGKFSEGYLKQGKITYYNKNGNIEEVNEGEFFQKGYLRNGKKLYYDKNGNIEVTETYKHGDLIGRELSQII